MFKSQEKLQKIQERFPFLSIKEFALFIKIGDIENLPVRMYELHSGIYESWAGQKKVKKFETLGLITIIVKGQKMYLTLTEKGKELIKNLKEIKKVLEIKI